MNADSKLIAATIRRFALILTLTLCVAAPLPAAAGERLTLGMRDASMAEVMAMLARQYRVNILLGDSVDSAVSFNLYDVTLDDAIRSIANAGGYAVERRQGTYFILPEEQAGKNAGSGFTVVRSFPVQYTDAGELENKLGDYLSDFGNITSVPERGLLVIEDRPDFVYRIGRLLTELDRRPPQVLIEAKILEIKLTDEQSYGIDWTGLFTNSPDGAGDFGTNSITPGNSGNAGFFFNYLEPNLEIALRALEADGRVRNLASPKVVTVVNEEAEVIIGDRRGYAVTTTINQVTTESIEFLESGTILRVTPSIDDTGEILLNIHPEVSVGTVDENGIPSQTTTEVTTQLLVESGASIFIGGLMRNSTTEGRTGVPFLGRIPGLRWLFSTQSRTTLNTETVVIITPRIVNQDAYVAKLNDYANQMYDEERAELIDQSQVVQKHIEDTFRKPPPSDKTRPNETSFEPPTGEVTTQVEPVTEPNTVVEPTADAATANSQESSTSAEISPESLAKIPPAAGAESPPVAGAVETVAASGVIARESDAVPVTPGPEEPVTEETKVDPPIESVADEPDAGEIEQVEAPEPETDSRQAAVVMPRPSAMARYAVNLHSDPKPIQTAKVLSDDSLLYVTEASVGGEKWYRLRLGFFDDEADAKAALAEWIREYPNAWLVRVGEKERASAEDNAL
ncbi:MAG: secretin N-terminal domain-containing protein [Gammaproteobacteria bacterium]